METERCSVPIKSRTGGVFVASSGSWPFPSSRTDIRCMPAAIYANNTENVGVMAAEIIKVKARTDRDATYGLRIVSCTTGFTLATLAMFFYEINNPIRARDRV